jgi:hypothetical protein
VSALDGIATRGVVDLGNLGEFNYDSLGKRIVLLRTDKIGSHDLWQSASDGCHSLSFWNFWNMSENRHPKSQAAAFHDPSTKIVDDIVFLSSLGM